MKTEPKLDMRLYRTKAGKLKAGAIKALQWYAIEHGLKLTAASAFPVFTMKAQSGEYQTVHIEKAVKDYAAFKKRTHGSKSSA